MSPQGLPHLFYLNATPIPEMLEPPNTLSRYYTDEHPAGKVENPVFQSGFHAKTRILL